MVLALILLLAAAPGFEEAFRNGLLALQRNDLPAAQAHLAAAAKLAPNDGRVQIALAQTHRKLHQSAKADAAAAQAALLGPNDALVQKSLALYYAEAGQVLPAAEAQIKYAALAPQDAAALERAESLTFEVVQPLLQRQKFGEAIAILKKAPLTKSAQLQLALGVAYYGQRRFDEATTAFLATIAIAPELEQPYVFLGQSLDQIPHRLAEVTRAFLTYETAHPNRALGYLLHAKATADPAAAQKLLEKAIALNAHDAASHFELGVILFQKQRYAEAAQELERSATLEPQNPATHYRLANVYNRLGKLDAAQVQRELHSKLLREQESSGR